MKQVHPIDEYIAARKRREASFNKGKFADLVGSDRSTIHRLMTGHPNVSHDVMDKIETATKGELTAVVLFTWWDRAKKAQRAAAQPKPKSKAAAVPIERVARV